MSEELQRAARAWGVDDVMAEVGRQDAKWGQQMHDPFVWLAVLTEEVGEFAEAVLKTAGAEAGNPQHEVGILARAELVQVAAVALQALWSLDLQGYWQALTQDARVFEVTGPNLREKRA